MGKQRMIDYDNSEMDSLSGTLVESSSTSISLPISADAVAVGVNYILHPVSKFDTLAGVAIKYGVEVADVKRLNGLVTDLQMFALKTLKIPLPGRHSPSPVLSNGHHVIPPRPSSSEHTPPNRRHSDLVDSFQSLRLKYSSERKVSPAMSSLQDFYGLRQLDQEPAAEGFEMAVYRNGSVAHDRENGRSPAFSALPKPKPPLSHPRKSKSVANGLESANGDLLDPLLTREAENGSSDKWIEKLLRRRQKSESDFTSWPPEKLLKEENSSSSSVSAITSKGLALRPKSAGRTVSGMGGSESVRLNPTPIGLGDSLLTDDTHGVQKSSSTSSLLDSDNGSLSSIWPSSTNWCLKPDFQALSSAALPMLDGLPKSIGRRIKAALD